MIAIIPAGGRGKRMLEVTGGASKETLPLAGRSVLDLVLDEAFALGVDRAVVISGRDKSDVSEIVSARTEHVDLRYQEQPLGLAHAIAAAREFDETALVLLPDTVFSPSSAAHCLANLDPLPDAAILAQSVGAAEASAYGMIEAEGQTIQKILEKPRPGETESRLAVAARYMLTDRVLRFVSDFVTSTTADGEWGLTEAFNRAILHGMRITVATTGARRFDCGSPEGYREARAYFDR